MSWTMSTYKKPRAGPASGLIVTNEPEIAERLDANRLSRDDRQFRCRQIGGARPMTLLDWKVHGRAYAETMVSHRPGAG